jgi:hypothetical protein
MIISPYRFTPAFVGATFYVNTAASTGGDGTTNLTTGATRAFASLREAITHAGLDVSSPRLILCSGTAADILSCKQAHWDSVSTTAANYLEIRGDNTTGLWNTSAYRIEVTNDSAIYNNNPGHVRIKNLQVQLTTNTSTGAQYIGYRLSTQNVGTGLTDCDCRVANSIAKGIHSGTDKSFGHYNSPFAETAGGTVKIWNCLSYDLTVGFATAVDGIVTHYNCTAHGTTEADFEDTMVCYNCLGASTGTIENFLSVGTGGGLSDYNASFDTSAKGTHKRISQTFTFVDAAGKNFHLDAADAGAKDFGVTNPGAGLYLDDIDGATRSGSWDIGADEV